jgi:hypothetical protein
MTIPRRTIQTARTLDLPPLALAVRTNLRLLHPDWEHLLFDDAGVREFVSAEFPEYGAVFDGFVHPIQRFDFFRYLAVFRLGGFYFDLDVILSRALTPLLDLGCVFPFEELTLSGYLRRQGGIDWEVGNYGFGAVEGSPFLDAVIDNCIRAQRDPGWARPMMEGIPRMCRGDFEVLNTTGPGLVTRTLAEDPEARSEVSILFPDDVCDAAGWHQFGSYGVHLMEGSWRGKGGAIRRRLACWLEARRRAQFMRGSRALGPRREFDPCTGAFAPAGNPSRAPAQAGPGRRPA